MAVTISGSTGISTPDGSAGTPAVKGTTSATAGLTFPAANTVAISTSSAEAMRIDSSGNVGIGTSSPSYSFHVNRTGAAAQIAVQTNTTAAYVYALYGSAVNTALISDATTSYLSAETNNALVLRTNATERARIDTSGNLLVGTTSVINGSNAIIQALNVNGGRPGINVGNSSGSSATNCLIFTNSNGTVGSIQTSGTSTSYVTSSDYRLKNSVLPMITGLATVSALKPVTYKWNADNSDGEGFIAHELQAVIPHAVTGEKDAVDADEKPIHQGVDYSKIVVHLVAAIQELKARVEALEAK